MGWCAGGRSVIRDLVHSGRGVGWAWQVAGAFAGTRRCLARRRALVRWGMVPGLARPYHYPTIGSLPVVQ